jgi:hypothetical protein
LSSNSEDVEMEDAETDQEEEEAVLDDLEGKHCIPMIELFFLVIEPCRAECFRRGA